jgi:N-acetylglutamate synthase-like GNAT family acetyltransferase
MDIQVSLAEPSQFGAVTEFYQSRLPAGYALNLDDTFVIASGDSDRLLGCVRLVRENGVMVLRAMQVSSEVQRRGVGRRLLEQLVSQLGDEECFCIPYPHLEQFYGLVGFRKISPEEAPVFLRERLVRYQKDKSFILMRRPGELRCAD